MSERTNNSSETEPNLRYRKFVLALAGLPMVGKSTLGRELANRSNLVLLESDEARWQIFLEDKGRILPKDKEALAMQLAHEKNTENAQVFLREGQPIILTGTFSRQYYHNLLKDLAQLHSTPLMIVLLTCSEDEIKRRLPKRSTAGVLSEEELFAAHQEVQKRYETIQGTDLLIIDTEQPFEVYFNQVLNFISPLRI